MSAPVHNLSIRKGIYIELVSMVWMVMEAAVAMGAGVMAHSLALTAFGTDSVIELIAGGVLLWRLTIESREASLSQVQRAERISSWVVGLALLVLAAYIVAASIVKLLTHQGAETNYVGLGLAIASGFVMPYLSRAKKRIGSEIGSHALRFDGSCSMVCAYMSWVVIAGVVLTGLLRWWWVDSVAALALVYYVATEGWEAVEKARYGEHAGGCCKD